MKSHFKAAGCGVLLVLLLTSGVAGASAAATFALGSSAEIPAAQGKVRLHRTKNGNVEIKLSVKHLAPPGRITPGSNVFVVWARGLAAGAAAQNLGALRVGKNLNGKLRSVTPLSSFDLFLTCEQTQTVAFPGTPELLPLHYMSTYASR